MAECTNKEDEDTAPNNTTNKCCDEYANDNLAINGKNSEIK
ncbi:MAG: hypothetical protein QW201_01380 [Thermoproteota archaeon]